VGVGPGFVTRTNSASEFFFNSSGFLSVIFGASNPSTPPPDYHFGRRSDEPYYAGPGLLGKVKFELGKKGLGSVDTGFSQYWINSIFYPVDELLGILSLNLRYDLSAKSQICLGYDYFIKKGSLQDRNFTKTKPALRALYVLKF
jgi:hypothetical protein